MESETRRGKRLTTIPNDLDNLAVTERLSRAYAVHYANAEAKSKKFYQGILIEREIEISKRFSQKNFVINKSLNAVYAVGFALLFSDMLF